ncbi:MAG: hypothetical protein IKN04_09120 [Clostridia bacterium]|nr:hypothetical protein [Clostridia bacterium]
MSSDNAPRLIVAQNEEAAKEESEKRIASQCDLPIDIGRSAGENLSYQIDHEAFKKARILYPAGHSSVLSEVFIAIWDMMDAIVKGTDWRKKARIVLEYDPRERKMELTVFRSTDEIQKSEDR